MAKRKFASNDPFGASEDDSSNSWVETTSQIFGDLQSVDAMVERIRKISIFDIRPDPVQPRRAIPDIVEREAIRMDQHQTISDVLMVWWGLTQDERGSEFNLGDFLETTDPAEDGESDSVETEFIEIAETDDAAAPGPIEAAFLKIIDLAASIRRDGLTNPITVAQRGETYEIETGERRWLAFHLLYAWYDGLDGKPDERKQYENVPARVVDEINVWRQASENNARANLNAIGKARQWAVLMMDLIGQQGFATLSDCANEQEYYAQVADLNVPYGKGEQLRNAMGVNGRAALTRYRKMLTLPNQIWVYADLYNTPEETLYNLARLPHSEALDQFYVQFDKSTTGRAEQTPADTEVQIEAPGTKRHFSRMTRAITKASPGKHKHNALALKSLRELRQWLDEQEARIMKFVE